MAEHVGATFIPCERGGPFSRIWSGMTCDYGDMPVLLGGGTPLLEAVPIDILRNSGPIIELACDGTHHDIVDPYPFRTRRARFAHKVGQRAVDGTITVSDNIAQIARRYDRPVRVVHPFILEERRQTLISIDPDLDEDRILCVGKYRPKNGQDIARQATIESSRLVRIDFVGEDTEAIISGQTVRSHGYVDDETFSDLFEQASLILFPARFGAFPVVVLEAMCAGIPVITTPYVGNANLVRGVAPELVVEPTVRDVSAAIDWYFNLDQSRRKEIGDAMVSIGSQFDEESGLDAFEHQFERVMEDL